MAAQKDTAPLALEYHGKATAQGHWRKNQELVDALAYIDPLTPDVKQQVDKLIEEEMRRSTLRPQDYLNKLPAMPPAKFEGHPLLQQEYQRVHKEQPMPALDVSRYRLDPPEKSKAGDVNAWAKACDNANAQLEHQLNRITNLELLLRYGANAWRAQTQLDESLLKQMEGTLQSLRKSIDKLNRERKLQQSAAGSELRVLEDQYYSALRKNLEISAACQSVEDDMTILQARMDKLTAQQQAEAERQQQAAAEAEKQQQQEGKDGQQQEGDAAAGAVAAAAGGQSAEVEQQQEGEKEQQEQQPQQNGVADANPDAAADADTAMDAEAGAGVHADTAADAKEDGVADAHVDAVAAADAAAPADPMAE